MGKFFSRQQACKIAQDWHLEDARPNINRYGQFVVSMFDGKTTWMVDPGDHRKVITSHEFNHHRAGGHGFNEKTK